MPLLQALDEECHYKILINYDRFREAMVAIYGDMDRQNNAEDRLAIIKQTGSVASYISMFDEHAT